MCSLKLEYGTANSLAGIRKRIGFFDFREFFGEASLKKICF
jgi:hypothetical protein